MLLPGHERGIENPIRSNTDAELPVPVALPDVVRLAAGSVASLPAVRICIPQPPARTAPAAFREHFLMSLAGVSREFVRRTM